MGSRPRQDKQTKGSLNPDLHRGWGIIGDRDLTDNKTITMGLGH